MILDERAVISNRLELIHSPEHRESFEDAKENLGF